VKNKAYLIDIEIDKLTNSIENVTTSDSFTTQVIPITKDDIKSISKKMDGISIG
jgi:hypothetical protein